MYRIYNQYYGIYEIWEQHIIFGFPKRITILPRITSLLDAHQIIIIVHNIILCTGSLLEECERNLWGTSTNVLH